MKSIIEKIKNLIPYFILITIYFLFINLEASNNMKKNDSNKNDFGNKKGQTLPKTTTEYDNQRIEIPVIPFDK